MQAPDVLPCPTYSELLRGSSSGLPRSQTIVNKSAGDDSTEAALDFMETLSIDDKEVSWFHDSVKLDALPTWELWRLDDNANEMCMDTFRSRAKAVACKERFEARGHRQTYWVRRR